MGKPGCPLHCNKLQVRVEKLLCSGCVVVYLVDFVGGLCIATCPCTAYTLLCALYAADLKTHDSMRGTRVLHSINVPSVELGYSKNLLPACGAYTSTSIKEISRVSKDSQTFEVGANKVTLEAMSQTYTPTQETVERTDLLRRCHARLMIDIAR